ncbi:NAD(+) synthase [Mesomycoplasma molare]|uniref:NH(3)-dependent NAD(+) synthetase n=1 Tax=Mesomycoplasma molare TaxID=171288 RepID=A0ABY5TTK8_9BACT|nr:NAD(+) synthase [Mesomycoplasma molare]UWD34002.1 NAD(+) synthase [Mesomycoplasma molare]
MEIEKYTNYLIEWLKDEVKKANMKGLIVGISGGIDSALVSVLAQKAFPNNSLGLIMPINSMEKDKEDIEKLVNKFNLNVKTINLKNAYDNLVSTYELDNKLAIANIKPRLRMTTLYAFAQEYKYLVLGTDNFSEMFLGYFTKYGDGGVDLLPIVQLTKSEVRKMASYLGIPKTIINKTPTAGLWDNQSDEEELGFTYNDLEIYLKDKNLLKPEIINLIEKQHKITQHKRDPLPRPKHYNEL